VRKLFLDDCRPAPDFTWDIVRSYDQFIAYIKFHGVPDIISFDHDLGDEHYKHYTEGEDKFLSTGEANSRNIDYSKFTEKTGYDCAKWLVENNLLPKQYFIHSMNPVGVMNIKFTMESAYKRIGKENQND
jgi:NAD+-processing family protein with receiver domain